MLRQTGCVLNFQVYIGNVTKTREKGLSHCVVVDLMQPYFLFKETLPICKQFLHQC